MGIETAPLEASFKPDMQARKELAQSKLRRRAKRRLTKPDSLEGWGKMT